MIQWIACIIGLVTGITKSSGSIVGGYWGQPCKNLRKCLSQWGIYLTDAREQFAASGSFLDLRLVMEDHHVVLLQNLSASQELVLAHTSLASRSCGLSAHRSCVFT